MITAGVLERAAHDGHPQFIIKGGVALELRLRDQARATKDIDVVSQDPDADLPRTLERALTGSPYQGFSFRRKREPLVLDNGVVNMEFAVSYRGGTWASITVDIARAESGESEVEWLEAIPLTEAFGVTGPTALPCLPLRLHIAQKTPRHDACTPARQAQRAVSRSDRSLAHGNTGYRLSGTSRRVRDGIPYSRHPPVATAARRAGTLGRASRTIGSGTQPSNRGCLRRNGTNAGVRRPNRPNTYR